MTGLAQRLDIVAREATGAVEFLPPELATRVRRRHRIRTSVGAAVVAACAAGASLYAATSSSGPQKVVRVATPPGVTSATTLAPSASGAWGQLAVIARGQAAQFGDPSPQRAEAVATDLAAFEHATGTGRTALTHDPLVYFVVVTGHFACGPSCYNVSGTVPAGTVLGLAVDQATLGIAATALTNQPVDLSRLGQVHLLDLAASAGAAPSASTSAAIVTVPNVIGLTETAAGTTLESVGLQKRVTKQSSNVVPPGVVISESPAPGSLVVVGSAISLTVSSGSAAGPSA